MALVPTIGLEIHAELLTRSKVFCTCGASFGGETNTRTCPNCAGLPGSLPVLNRSAVEFIIRAGLITDCEIAGFTKWDRKNYFYPDLPKAYQISQMTRPVCVNGHVIINAGDNAKNIRINRIHLEEDAGKLVHDGAYSLADYNRCGVPLIELVTEPDFHEILEVTAFVEQIRLRYLYAGICDGRMEQGSLRCDVNISLAEDGAPLGTRTEIKNLNSTRNIARAIEYEIWRQTEVLRGGGAVIQETRSLTESGETAVLRSKEDADDYRYFPDPDIPPLVVTLEEIAQIKAGLPEMPHVRQEKYLGEYCLTKPETDILLSEKALSDFYDGVVSGGQTPRVAANYVLSELLYRLNLGEGDIGALPFTPADFSRLITLVESGQVNRANLKEILRQMLESGKKPDDICEENNYIIKEDLSLVSGTIAKIIAENPAPVAQYRAGEQKVFGFLMGLANKQLKESALPKAIKEELTKQLGARE